MEGGFTIWGNNDSRVEFAVANNAFKLPSIFINKMPHAYQVCFSEAVFQVALFDPSRGFVIPRPLGVVGNWSEPKNPLAQVFEL